MLTRAVRMLCVGSLIGIPLVAILSVNDRIVGSHLYDLIALGQANIVIFLTCALVKNRLPWISLVVALMLVVMLPLHGVTLFALKCLSVVAMELLLVFGLLGSKSVMVKAS